MGSFFLPNWSPPDDPARPLPAEGRPWPSDDDDDGDDDDDDDDDKTLLQHPADFPVNHIRTGVRFSP